MASVKGKTKKKSKKKAVSKKKSARKKPVKKARKTKGKRKVSKKKAAKKKAAQLRAGKRRPQKKKPTKKAKKKVTKKRGATKKKVVKKGGGKRKAISRPRKVATAKSISWSKFITPLDDRVIIERVEKSDRTPGGIIIPESVDSPPYNRGRVVLVGRGHLDNKGRVRPLDVSVGDQVLWAPHSGTEMNLNENNVIILREDEILGVCN